MATARRAEAPGDIVVAASHYSIWGGSRGDVDAMERLVKELKSLAETGTVHGDTARRAF